MSYSSEVLADSPLAYYRLGDASGTTMTDSSGNGRNGTYTGVTLGTTGLLTGDPNTAMTVNGATARGDVADAAWMDVGSTLTVEAWIKTSQTGTYQYIANRDTNGRLWEMRLTNTGVLQVEKIVNGYTASTASGALNDGVRHHVVFTYDGSNIRLYVDGSLAQTTAATGSLDGTAIFAIGATYAGTGGYGPHRFIGVIDEVAYYGSTLSGARIAAHYAAGTTTTSNATVTATTATATAAAVVPVVSASMAVAAPAATATAVALAPVASVDATVTAPTATATAAALAPVITVPGNQTVLAPAASATASAAAPSLAWDATLSAATATATAAALVPVVSAGVAVSAPTAAATAAALAPTTSTFSADATVSAPTALATATALAPVWTQVLSATTDTSNGLGGISLEGSATVTIARPVAAPPATLVLAEKVDKAAAYPTPTMVDGRPT